MDRNLSPEMPREDCFASAVSTETVQRVQFDPEVKQNECLIKCPIDIDKLETRYKIVHSDQDRVPNNEVIMDQYDKYEPDLDLPQPPTEPQVRSMNTKNPNQPSILKRYQNTINKFFF